MKNTIAERIYDFLKNYPPFSFLSVESCYEIASNIDVVYLEEGQYVFKIHEGVHTDFYVVKDGAIGLFREGDALLADECDEGDIFGLRAVIRKGNYILSAKAIEESIIYAIPARFFEEIISQNAEANKFLMASFVTNFSASFDNEDLNPFYDDHEQVSGKADLSEVQSAQYSKDPVTCTVDTSIKEAARTMTAKRVGSIIITDKERPLGIITDKDMRTKIATGFFSIDDKVGKIMSSPVISYPKNITVAEAQIAMMQHKITHLCITEDGTTQSRLMGILSEHDIVVIHGNNPSVLIKEVKRATSVEALKAIRKKVDGLLEGYISQNIPVFYISKIISSINEAITQKTIELAIIDMEEQPPTAFGWLLLGSQGRKEQLLLTDQDNALIFEDVNKKNYDKVKNYFLLLAKKVTESLNFIGFEYCPANMMASNPKWCLSVSGWKAQFKNWITLPDEKKIMLCTIFFDFDLVYGHQELADDLADSIFDSIDSYEIFLNFLGLNALQNPPPLSFFRQFLVEHGGQHKDQFDIKARAMMPLVDAARLLILSKNIKGYNNTIRRYEKLGQLEPQNKELYDTCISSFKILLKFRTEQGIKNMDSGRFIDLQTLGKSDKLKLKSCFKSVKDIQELVQVRFNLAQMM